MCSVLTYVNDDEHHISNISEKKRESQYQIIRCACNQRMKLLKYIIIFSSKK